MKILFVLLLALGCYANPTGSELKKTPSTAFDFTFQSPQNKIQETLSDMILIEISKQTFLERRQENLWQCQTDQFGTTYCPSGLATARPYTSYYQSTSYERESTVKDYQNGSAVSSTGSVVDYASKVSSPTYVSQNYILSSVVTDSSGSGPTRTSSGKTITMHLDWKTVKITLMDNGTLSSVVTDSSESGPTRTSSGKTITMHLDWKTVKITLIGSCPSGTVQEGNQCKGINYVCPSGYTDNGSNCKKTVNYAFYNYTCPSGYTVANSGLTSCPKTDPNITADNTSTLDVACNSATPPTSNCSKSISYKYYEYLCQAKNSFLEPIKNLNSGLKSPCAKSDPNNTIDNTGTLDDACNSSTPPVNNCQSTEYTCDSTLFKPVYVNGKWQCSPFMCDGKMKCGYGTCDLPTTPSATKYQDVAYNPLQYITNNQCNGDICDYVLNAKVSYCESQQCPKGDDIIEKNGKCYKLECPAGTYLSGEKCIKVN